MSRRDRAGIDFCTALLPYGETLQQHRRIFHQVLRTEASDSYRDMYLYQAKELVVNLLNVTIDPQEHIKGFVLDSMVSL